MDQELKQSKKGLDEFYPLIPPHAFANLKWDDQEEKIVYLVKEPDLSDSEERKLEKIREDVIEKLEMDLAEVKEKREPEEYIEEKADTTLSKFSMGLSSEAREKIFYYLKRDLAGLGKLEPLMNDPNLEEVSCDGTEAPVFAFHREYGSLETNVWYEDSEELNSFISKLAQRTGRHISAAEPMLEGSLPDGSRLHCTYKGEVTRKGPTFTIRKFREDPLTPIDLIESGSINHKVLAFFWHLVENGYSALVSGGTATGKTTMLNVISLFIPPGDKIVSIEDTPELRLPHKNWLPSVSRPGYGPEDYGEIDLFDLVKASLRQRPDYVIPGEVRGEEAYVLFQAMATGHAGLATIHAENVSALKNRLLTPPVNLSASLLTSLDAVIFLGFSDVDGEKVRRMKHVTEITGMNEDEEVTTQPVFSYQPGEDTHVFNGDSAILREMARRKGEDVDDIKNTSVWQELKDKTEFLKTVQQKGVEDIDEFAEYLTEYRQD
ncbi:MAG: type II/IV secretion system ATPase subunit [Candidatus Nanosalina sp.]